MSVDEQGPRPGNGGAPSNLPGVSPDSRPAVEQLLEGMVEGFFALDSDWRFVAFNRAAEDMFGLAREEVIGRTLWDVSPTVIGSEFERRYRRVMETREKQAFESFTTGEPRRWLEVRAFPLGDGVGVSFVDATDRRAVLERLGQREAELRRVQEIGGVGGMRVDIGGAGFAGRRSPEYLKIHGLPERATVETHEDWVARIHPDDRERAVGRFLAALEGDTTAYASEYRIVRPSDGAVRWIRALGEIERDGGGRPVALVGVHSDITERKAAEQDAVASEDRLRAIADALPVLISYIDAGQIFRFVNKTYEIWFGRPRDEIVGRRVDEVMTPEMYAARRDNLERALAGETVTYEVEFPRPEGLAFTEVVHVPHRDAAGQVLGVYVVVTDITQRKAAERAIAESEARFRAIADSAPVLIWVTGPDGRREYVSQAYLEFFGGTYEEVLAYDWRRALHPDDLPRILATAPTVDARTRSVDVAARFRRADGSWRWLQAKSQPRWSVTGEHVGYIGVAFDVTDARRAQRALARIKDTLERRVEERTSQLAASEALVRTFFQHSPEYHAVLVEDRDGFRFQEINPATLRLYGLERRDDVVGRTTGEVLGAQAGGEVDRHLRACLAGHGPYRYERDQEGRLLEAVASAVPDGGDRPRRVVVSARDVTDRRRLEEQLRQAQKMEALGHLTGGVAHDFNNMLTVMLGGLDSVDRHVGQLPESPARDRIARGAANAIQGVRRARALTSRLLAFSRRQALEPQGVDPNALIGGLSDLLQRTLGETIVLRTHLADGAWTAYVDPGQLESALVNLALNARDAMPDGGSLVIETANRALSDADAAAFPEPVEPGDYVAIAVADTGVGMDPATIGRAFEPFFTTKDVGKGTGLGLSQVYGFCRQSGGHAAIESEPGRGATVRLLLPRHAAKERPASAPARALVSGGGRENILLVEDDDNVRAYATDALRELGYRVAEAPSGRVALDILESAPRLDLLLTDVIMPGEYNGRTLAEEATRRRPGLRVLYMTGYSRDALSRDGRLRPGVHVLGKPFSLDELAAKVRSRLDQPS